LYCDSAKICQHKHPFIPLSLSRQRKRRGRTTHSLGDGWWGSFCLAPLAVTGHMTYAEIFHNFANTIFENFLLDFLKKPFLPHPTTHRNPNKSAPHSKTTPHLAIS